MGYLYLLVNIVLTVYSQLILKWRLNALVETPEPFFQKLVFLIRCLFDPFIFSGVLATFLAAVAWMAALTKFQLSYVYPFSSLSFVLIFICSYWLLNETVNVYKILGLAMIVIGIVIVSKQS